MIKKQLNEVQVVVVGGGAAGIELCFAIRARWNDLLDSKLSISLIDSSDALLSSETDACRSALLGLMEKYDINVRNNLIVDEVTSSHIHVRSTNSDNGGKRTLEKIPFGHCIWATGAEAHTLSFDLNKEIGLDITNRGWIRVNKHLQSLSHPSIFAAGDCCEIIGDKKSPKAGVYAVRSGPILIENLIRYLGQKSHTKKSELVTYDPQDDFLKLIMCGDGTALGFRFGIPIYGSWVWKLKDHIDTMFMDLFDVNKLPKYNKEEGIELDTAQYDTYETAKEKMKVEDAAKLLLRRDDDVDYQTAWSVIREMNTDEDYRKEVLRLMNDSPDIWW
jgi:selenide, water dikinase